MQRVLDHYTVEGTLWPMPFNVSNPVLFYDKDAFRAAGLDPEKPPATLDEVKDVLADTEGLRRRQPGGLRAEARPLVPRAVVAPRPAKLYVNNENGRAKRATETVFDNPTGLEIFTWMNDMVSSGLAEDEQRRGPVAVRQPARHPATRTSA